MGDQRERRDVSSLINSLGRARWTLAGVLLWLLLAPPAVVAAHGQGSDIVPTNFRTVINQPGAADLHWQAVGGDALIELTSRSTVPVTVLGYSGEPYLLFEPDGTVLRNANSPATYINTSRYGGLDTRASVSALDDPVWRTVAIGGTFRWHDHRAHWMSPRLPPGVDAAPGVEQLIQPWEIPLQVGGKNVSASGELWWIPDVSPWPPVVWSSALGIAAVAVAIGIAIATRGQVSSAVWPLPGRVAAVAAAVPVAGYVVRTLDDLRVHDSASGADWFVVIFAVLLTSALGLLLIRAWRGDAMGYVALAVAGAATYVLLAVPNSVELSAPILPTEFAPWVRRWAIGSAMAALLPVGLAASAGLAWLRAGPRADEQE